MARSESPDTRLLLSLVRRRLALLSIYSAAQRLRDREQSTLCAVNSYWFAVNWWQGKQKYRCAGSVTYLLVSSIKANFPRYRHYLKSRFGNIVYYADLGMHLTSGGMPLNGIAQSDKAGCQTTCFSHRIGRNIWQRIFVFMLHVDISSGFTFKVSGACALRKQVTILQYLRAFPGKLMRHREVSTRRVSL